MPRSAQVGITPAKAESVDRVNYYPADLSSAVAAGLQRLGNSLQQLSKEYSDAQDSNDRAELLAQAQERYGAAAEEFNRQPPNVVTGTWQEYWKQQSEQFLEPLDDRQRRLIADRLPLMTSTAAVDSLRKAYAQIDESTKTNYELSMRRLIVDGPSMSVEELAQAQDDSRRASAAYAPQVPGVNLDQRLSDTMTVVNRSREQNGLKSTLAFATEDPAQLTAVSATLLSYQAFQEANGRNLTEADYAYAKKAVDAINSRNEREARRLAAEDKRQERALRSMLTGLTKEATVEAQRDRANATAEVVAANANLGRELANVQEMLRNNPTQEIDWVGVEALANQTAAAVDRLGRYDRQPVASKPMTPAVTEALVNVDTPVPMDLIRAIISVESGGGVALTGDGGLAKGPFQLHPEVRARYGGDSVEAGVAYLTDLWREHGGDPAEVLLEFHLGKPNYDAYKAGTASAQFTAEALQAKGRDYLDAVTKHVGTNVESHRVALQKTRDWMEGMKQAQDALRIGGPEGLQGFIDSAKPQHVGPARSLLGAARQQMDERPETVVGAGYAVGAKDFAERTTAFGVPNATIEQWRAAVTNPATFGGIAAATATPWTNSKGYAVRADMAAKLLVEKGAIANPATAATVGSLFMHRFDVESANAVERGIKALYADRDIVPTDKQVKEADSSRYEGLIEAANRMGTTGADSSSMPRVLVDLVNAAYVGLGGTRQTFDKDLWSTAYKLVFKNERPTNVNGRVVLMPTDTFDRVSLGGRVDRPPFNGDWSLFNGEPGFERGKYDTRPDWQLMQEFAPVRVGPGQYMFESLAQRGRFLRTKDNRALVLDLNR